jgi:hypothetical protein
MTVRLEIHDSHRGELSGRVEAWLEGGGVWVTGPDGKETQQGTRVGYVDFSEYDDEIWIKYVHVQPEYRRRGVATAMYKKLTEEFPGEQIVSSGTTGEGGELRKSLKERGIIAADEALDYGAVINVLHKLMPDVDPSLPEPQIRIADYTRSKWLGRTEWKHGDPNTVILLQKAICYDEETLTRVLAHELVHHEQMLKVWSTYPGGKGFDRRVRQEGGHGWVFKEIADRWNAKHGKDFITAKSDESYEKQFTERPFFLLLSRTSWGSPRWQASIRISGKQKIWMTGKNMEEYRLTQTTDQDFVNSPNIGSRHWEYPHRDDHGLILSAEAMMKMPDLRLQWDEKPPATIAEEKAKRQEIYEKMREWSRARRQKKTEKWFQDLKDKSDAYQQSKASAVNTQPTPEVLEEARALRTELRMGDTTAIRGQGNCGFIADAASQKYGWDVYAGLYLEDNGKQIDHVWNVSEDGTIIDITHDQFGPPDINVVKLGQPGYDDYHAYCWQYLPENEADACPICGNGVVNEESQPDEDMEELEKTSSQKVGLDVIRKQARVSQNLTWLVNYLTMSRRDMGEEIARAYTGYFIDWLRNNDFVLPKKFKGWRSFLTALEDYDEAAWKAVPDQLYEEFLEPAANFAMENDPAYSPSFIHLTYKGIVKNEWLVHFTDYADSVAKQGFTRGVSDLAHLGLTTYFKDEDKKGGGYNFAVPVNDAHSIEAGVGRNNVSFGSEAVLFRASGVNTYHSGDEFYQIIFWGKTAKDIIPLYHTEGKWFVNEVGGDVLFESPDIEEVARWAIANINKYSMIPRAAKKRTASTHKKAFIVDTLVDLKNYLQMDEHIQGEELARLYPDEFVEWLEGQDFEAPTLPVPQPKPFEPPEYPGKWNAKDKMPWGFVRLKGDEQFWTYRGKHPVDLSKGKVGIKNHYGDIIAQGRNEKEAYANWSKGMEESHRNVQAERAGRDFWEALREGEEEVLALIPPETYKEYLEHGSDWVMQHDPANAPSFMLMTYQGIVRNQWLVHMTDNPDEIARDGFLYGMHDLGRLGLTTYFTEKAKKIGGYNFGVPVADANQVEGKYGKHAVVFRASGVNVYHSGDNEDQVIFWGRAARDIVPIYHVDSGWHLPADRNGKPVFVAEDLRDAALWVAANFDQYRWMAADTAKIIPPKPKQKRAAHQRVQMPRNVNKYLSKLDLSASADLQMAVWNLEEGVDYLNSLELPITVYRELEIVAGSRVDFGHTGVSWSVSQEGAQAYFGPSSIWSPVRGVKGEFWTLRAVIESESQIDWEGTLHANVKDPEESEIRLVQGASIKLTGVMGPKDKNFRPANRMVIAAARSEAERRVRKMFKQEPDCDVAFIFSDGTPLRTCADHQYMAVQGLQCEPGKQNAIEEFMWLTGAVRVEENIGEVSFHVVAPPTSAQMRRMAEMAKENRVFWFIPGSDTTDYWNDIGQEPQTFADFQRKLDEAFNKTADSHKQTPHRENDFESLGEGEGLEGYANQPECEGGNKTIIPMNVLEEQAKLTMTASPVSHFPSWDEFVEKEGGIVKIVNGFGSSWDQWEPYDRAETEAFDALEQKEKREYLERRAYEDLENRYYDVLGDHSMWSFPLDVYRVVTLKDIRGLKRRGIGVFWSWDEDAAEAHWGNFGPGYQKYIIHAQVQEQDVDWEATVWVNLDPSLGQEEKEIRLKEGTHPQILGWKETSENEWHQPPAAWKNVTAASSWVIPKEAAKVGYVYHVTYANRLEDIIWQGLEPGHPPVIGENYGWHTKGRIFFSDPRGVGFWVGRAEEWAYHNSDSPVSDGMIPVVLRIKEYKRYGFEEDEYGTGDAGAEAFFTQKTIPASRIEMWDGKVWRKLNEDLLSELGLYGFGSNDDFNPNDREGDIDKDEYLDTKYKAIMNPKVAVGQTIGQVYLLHFLGGGLGHGSQANVRHYCGWAENAEARIAQHMKGTSRARIMEVAHERGVEFTVARVWDNVAREFERKLKNSGGLSRHCPICKAEGTDRDTVRKKQQAPAVQEVQVAPAAPEAGPDHVEVETGGEGVKPVAQ